MSHVLFLVESLDNYQKSKQLGQWIFDWQQKGHTVTVCALTSRRAYDCLLPSCHCYALLQESQMDNPFCRGIRRQLKILMLSWQKYIISRLPPRMLLSHDYDIVIGDQSPFAMELLGHLPERCRKIAWIQRSVREYSPRLIRIYQRCDQILCASEALTEEFHRLAFRSGRIAFCPVPDHSLPPRRIAVYSASLSYDMLRSLLSAVCRLQEYPAQLYLLGHHPQEALCENLLKAAHAVILPASPSPAFIPQVHLLLKGETLSENALQAQLQRSLSHPLLPMPHTLIAMEELSHEIYNLSS